MAEYDVVLFHSTAHAIRAETVLEEAEVPIKLIPTPRQLSSDCGIAVRFDRLNRASVAAILKEKNVPINGIHAI
jgi:hypothetical protein